MAAYRQRVVDRDLDELLGPLAAIALEGAKGVGKTATAERRVSTVVRLDEPAQRDVAAADPNLALNGPPPVLLDEWQRVPSIWDAVRRAVDDRDPPGPFLLTGSAVPSDGAADPQRHSGAGRIHPLRMRPMTISERLGLTPTVSLAGLLTGAASEVGGKSDLGLLDYTQEILRSGFPGLRELAGRPLRVALDGYVDRIIDRDFPNELGERVRQPDVLRRWMRAYAAATATTTTLEKIRDAASHGQATPAKTSTIAYRTALQRLFILDPVDGWSPTNNHLKRLTQAPKHHLVDPALAASLLGMTEAMLLQGTGGPAAIPRDGTLLGALFESLVTQSARVFAQTADASVRHLRTQNGRQEVDLVIEDRAGGVLALEVKLSATVADDDVRHLHWLRSQIGSALRDAAVITTGRDAYRRSDGIAVVPLALLGP